MATIECTGNQPSWNAAIDQAKLKLNMAFTYYVNVLVCVIAEVYSLLSSILGYRLNFPFCYTN